MVCVACFSYDFEQTKAMCERYNKAIDSLRQLVSTFQFLYQNLTCKRTFHVGCRTLCWNAPYVVFGRTLVHTLNITRSCFSMTHTGSLGLGSLSFVHRFWVLIVDRLQYSAQRKGCGGGGGGLIVDRLQSSAQRKGWVGGGKRSVTPHQRHKDIRLEQGKPRRDSRTASVL